MKKNNEEQNENEIESNADWILRHFTCEGLNQHNKSIEWLIETIEKTGCTVERMAEVQGYHAECFTIRLRGTSGVVYRICVKYQPVHARLLAQRITEVDFDDDLAIGTIMWPFNGLMDSDTSWFDARDGGWESLCIHGRRDVKPKAWPGDTLISLLHTLSQDLRSSLERPMTTLRRELRKAYPVAWFNKQTPNGTTFEDVIKHTRFYEALQDAPDEETFDKLRELALEELFGEEVA
jgi:hypothetical protein